MKNQDSVKVNVLRLIKTEFVKKEKEGKELTEAIEATILTKMVAQREDSINQFTKANRFDLVEKEQAELSILKEFAPKEVSEEDIIAETEGYEKYSRRSTENLSNCKWKNSFSNC